MIYIKKLYFVLFIFIKTSLVGQTVSNNDSSLIRSISHENFSLYYSTTEIDKKIIPFLKRKKGMILKMVEPSEEYNRFDMVIENFPNKRLILYGEGNTVNFIFFEVGANALHNICLIYKKYKKNIYAYTVIGLGIDIQNLEQLKIAIQNKDYRILSK